MRLFLHHVYDMYRSKTQRLDLPNINSTDQLIDMICAKLHKQQHRFRLRFKIAQQYVRIIRGWLLSHYNIEQQASIYIQFDDVLNEQKVNKNNKQRNNINIKYELDFSPRMQEQEGEQYIKIYQCIQDLLSKMNSDISFNQRTLQNYLDLQLQILLKQIKKGDLEKVSYILRNIPQISHHHILNTIIIYKETKMLNQLGKKGWGSLHFAVFYQHTDIIQFLLIKNANINKQTSDGWTPLQIAIQKKNQIIIKTLLRHPYLQINQNTSRGTALHVAVRMNLPEFVKFLMQNNADPSIIDQYCLTPLDICESKELKQLLNKKDNNDNKQIGDEARITCGYVWRVKSIIYTQQERYLCCNPFQGTIKQYLLEQDYPLKSIENININQIKYVKMIRKKDKSWLMKKDHWYFQIFTHNRYIFSCKYQKIAKQWVKSVFESTAYKLLGKKKLNKNEEKWILDDSNNEIKNVNAKLVDRTSNRNSIFQKKNGQSILALCTNRIPNIKTQIPVQQIKNNQILHINTSKFIPIQQVKQTQQTNSLQQITQKIKQQSKIINQHIIKNDYNNDRISAFSTVTQKRKSFSQSSQSSIDQRIQFSSFKIMRILGEGAFGKVFLAKFKNSQSIFALKALDKINLLKKKQLKYAVSEANILRKLDHPFIIRLHCTFQTQKYLYMCLDYCASGDLSEYLAQKVILSENHAKLIVAQILLAIQHWHNANIVYRDLKPENILLCQDGYIKVTDFGLSKENMLQYTHSFCGSPAYLSPEMLNKQGVGKQSDIYGLGCILYEMLMGEPPYFNENIEVLYKNIRQAKIKFSPSVSFLAKDMILCLLERDRQKRIKIDDIKDHLFFKGIDFDALARKQIGSIQFPPKMNQQQQSGSQENQYSDKKNKFTDCDDKKHNRRNHVLNFSFSRL